MTPEPRPQWHRDGPTWVNEGMIPSDTTGPYADDGETWLDGDTYTSYYRCDDGRCASSTYYVLRTMTWNQPEVVETWVVEEMDWCGIPLPGDDWDDDYQYESASAFFYESAEKAHAYARRCADSDESFAWG